MKILVIEDEPDMLDNLVRSLQREKYLIETATTLTEAFWKKYQNLIIPISFRFRSCSLGQI